jgi:hypothetical protein
VCGALCIARDAKFMSAQPLVTSENDRLQKGGENGEKTSSSSSSSPTIAHILDDDAALIGVSLMHGVLSNCVALRLPRAWIKKTSVNTSEMLHGVALGDHWRDEEKEKEEEETLGKGRRWCCHHHRFWFSPRPSLPRLRRRPRTFIMSSVFVLVFSKSKIVVYVVSALVFFVFVFFFFRCVIVDERTRRVSGVRETTKRRRRRRRRRDFFTLRERGRRRRRRRIDDDDCSFKRMDALDGRSVWKVLLPRRSDGQNAMGRTLGVDAECER